MPLERSPKQQSTKPNNPKRNGSAPSLDLARAKELPAQIGSWLEDRLEPIRSWASTSPLSIPPHRWRKIGIISSLIGFVLYYGGVYWAYCSVRHQLLIAPPSEVAFLQAGNADTGGACSNKKTAENYASAFNISNQDTIAALSAALCLPGKASDIPAITVAERLVHKDGQCGGKDCSPECANYWREWIARLLGGSFLSSDATLTVKATGGSGDKCDISEPWTLWIWNLWNRFWGIFRKPDPVSAPDVAQRLLGLERCVGDNKDTCVLVTRLLQSALDSDIVRPSRTAVNMICGFERLFVFILFFVMLLSLSYRSIVRLNLDEQKKKTLDEFQKTLANKIPDTPASKTPEVLFEWFEQNFLDTQDNPEFTPIRKLLKATKTGGSVADIDSRAAINSELFSQSRVVLDTLITVFPVIGFAATLWGLIVALSSANLIASSVGDERNAHVMRVTSELSSCFSTTLLALLSMTLFAVWSTVQAKHETALVTDIHQCCLSIFRSQSTGRS